MPIILRFFSTKWELIATIKSYKCLQKSVQKIAKSMSKKLSYVIKRHNLVLKLFEMKAS